MNSRRCVQPSPNEDRDPRATAFCATACIRRVLSCLGKGRAFISDRRAHILALTVLVLFFVAAPTPGDIGGCGEQAELLDARNFYISKAAVDCARCAQCELQTGTCVRACDDSHLSSQSFADRCYPLVHDGDVCLRALEHASCDEYSSFVRDSSPLMPSECNFCPPR